MDRRLELHDLLLEVSGIQNVYFQPPSNVEMKYPAIVYNRDNSSVEHAGNLPYRLVKRWSVTVIDRNPDSPIPDKIERLPMCTANRFYPAEGLNHSTFTLYF